MVSINKITKPLLSIFIFLSPIAIANVLADTDNFSPAVDTIHYFHDQLLMLMKMQSERGSSTRYQKILPVVESTFDFTAIAKVIFSRRWNYISKIKQQEIIVLLTQLTAAHYADQFSGFNNEKFRIIATQSKRQDRIIVKTNLITTDNDIIQLDYLMHQRHGAWKIIGVIANGINDLALKRSEYANILKNADVETLLKQIRKNINNLRNP